MDEVLSRLRALHCHRTIAAHRPMRSFGVLVERGYAVPEVRKGRLCYRITPAGHARAECLRTNMGKPQ